MLRFAYFNPRAAANEELNETIEVDLNTSTTPEHASYSFSTASYSETTGSVPMSYESGESGRATEESEVSKSIEVEGGTNTKMGGSSHYVFEHHSEPSLSEPYSETIDSLTMSYESGESERSTEELEVSGKKSSANEGKGKPFRLLMSPTQETSAVSWLSQTFSEGQKEGGVENSAENVDGTDADRESEDENGSVDMKCLVGGIVNATEDIGHRVEDIKNVCVVDKDASSEGQENECVVMVDASIESEACRSVASPDKLAAMMRDRVQAIKSIRGLLEREHQENDTVVELNNKMKILSYDVACKGQANKELMKTVNYLKSKNKDYAQQMRQLSSTVDELVLTKNENIQRISVLESEAAAKTIMIDEITAETHNMNFLVEEKTAANDELTEQLQRFKAENDGLKAAVEDLESKNTTFASELENMMSSMQEVVELNGNLQAQVKQVNLANEELREDNNANVKKNAESLELIEGLTKSLNNERTIHEREMDDMKKIMETEKEVNAIITRKLEKTLEDVTARMTAQMSALEDDVAAKKNMIDEITAEIQEKVVENAALTEQLERSNAESDGLKAAVEDLESKNTTFADELENMMSSMQEVVELNGKLQAQAEKVNEELCEENNANMKKNAESLELIEGLTKSLNDERTIHEREMDDMKKIMETEKEDNAVIVRKLEEALEDVTARMTAQMSALEDDVAAKKNMIDELERSNAESDGLKATIQNLESKNTTFASELEKLQAEKESSDATMANLVTSLEEAMVYREDVSCQNKQIQAKIEEVKRFVAQSFENVAGAIGQLEKDVEEEFQVTTQLKDGTEKLVLKLREDKNSNYVSDVESLLGNVRMIQSWQLSHFQLVNELVTQNRDQVRSIQLLPAFRTFNSSK